MCVLSPGRYKTDIQQSTSSDIDGTRVGLVWRASRGYISGRGITSAAQSSLQPSLGVAQVRCAEWELLENNRFLMVYSSRYDAGWEGLKKTIGFSWSIVPGTVLGGNG